MVGMMVGDEEAIDVFGGQIQSRQSLLELRPAETLVDEHFDRRGLKQGRVASTAGTQMRDGHGHANMAYRTREGLEHTDRSQRKALILRGMVPCQPWDV